MGLTEISTKLEEMRKLSTALEQGLQELLSTEGLSGLVEVTPAQPLVEELGRMKSMAFQMGKSLLIERVAVEKTIAAGLGQPGGLDGEVKKLGWEFGGYIQGKWVAYLMSDGPEAGVITKEAREVSGAKLLESIRQKNAGR